MKKQMRIAIIIRLVARIWGSLSLIILVAAVSMHVIGALLGSGENGEGSFNSLRNILTFITFPLGTMIGLVLAWKWEGLGGLIITGAIICHFIIRPDLIRELWLVAFGFIGLMFLAYWALSRNQKKASEEPVKSIRKSNRKDVLIAVFISLSPVLFFVYLKFHCRAQNKSYITTEKDPSFDQSIENVLLDIEIDEPLLDVFSHSFHVSLLSVLDLNGIKVVVADTLGKDSVSANQQEFQIMSTEYSLRIKIKPVYHTKDDGNKAIVGTEYEASLIDQEIEEHVWYASGKEEDLLSFSSKYNVDEEIRKKLAWHTTEAIVNALVSEINAQEPAFIATHQDDREHLGQPTE